VYKFLRETFLTNSDNKYINRRKTGGHHLNEVLNPFLKFLDIVLLKVFYTQREYKMMTSF
jgi:hypothetical protein